MGLDYRQWRGLLAGRRLPAAVVDLDALDHNLAVLLGRLGEGRPGVTLRVASKSVRVPWVLRYLLERGGAPMRGLMTYSAHETAALAREGFDDLLLAYPIARRDEADVLAAWVAEGVTLRVAVDHPDHVGLLSEAAVRHGVVLRLCLDVDVSWRPLGGRLHFGVRRSPVRDGTAAALLAARIADAPGVILDAVLAYEAQVAGLRESNPTSRHLDPIRRLIRRRSVPLATGRRAEIVERLRRDGHDIAVVNGGGTGSVTSTSRDPSVTEVTAGSGFYCPHLFDGYEGLPLWPAAFYALAVVRTSDPGFVTCGGGGYIASGAAGSDRLPVVHLPSGLTPVTVEGFGEVQTPFEVTDGPPLAIGDPVICRHAKAGELFERFDEVLLVRGGVVIDTVPTHRALGICF